MNRNLDRPGGGFLVLLLVALGAAVFFGWGLQTPTLDDFWRIQLELRLGKRGPLTSRELALVDETLCRYPALAEAGLISANRDGLVDNGWAYVVGKSVEVAVPSGERGKRIEIVARTQKEQVTGEAKIDLPFNWTPKPGDGCDRVIEVLTSSKRAMRIGTGAVP